MILVNRTGRLSSLQYNFCQGDCPLSDSTDYSTDYSADYPYGLLRRLPLRTTLNNQPNLLLWGKQMQQTYRPVLPKRSKTAAILLFFL